MLTENGVQVDFEKLEQILRRGDVITIGFGIFPERILVDTRSRDGEGPHTTIAPPVATVQERYLWLGKHRGAFGPPRAFSFFVWPQSVRSLVDSGALATLRRRLSDAGGQDSITEFDRALVEAVALEKDAYREAICGGEPWTTVWSATGSSTP